MVLRPRIAFPRDSFMRSPWSQPPHELQHFALAWWPCLEPQLGLSCKSPGSSCKPCVAMSTAILRSAVACGEVQGNESAHLELSVAGTGGEGELCSGRKKLQTWGKLSKEIVLG